MDQFFTFQIFHELCQKYWTDFDKSFTTDKSYAKEDSVKSFR